MAKIIKSEVIGQSTLFMVINGLFLFIENVRQKKRLVCRVYEEEICQSDCH